MSATTLLLGTGCVAAAALLANEHAGSGRVGADQAGTGRHIYWSCPATDRRLLTSTAAGAHQMLVPAGAHAVLLCRYRGLDPVPSEASRLLIGRLVTRPRTVARLAAELNALRPFQSGTYSCPADFGVKIIAIFRYGAMPGDPVTLDPGGCAPVSNGVLTRTAGFAPGPKLIRQLEGLTSTR